MDAVIPFIDKCQIDNECEIMFFNYKDTNKMSYSDFSNAFKYKNVLAKTYKSNIIYQLDIIVKHTRIQINDLNKINLIINFIKDKSNYYGLKLVLENYKNNYVILQKNRIQKIDIDDFNIRLRESEEKLIDSIDFTEKDNIIFRYKQRNSIIIHDDKDYKFTIDLTFIRQLDNINYIFDKFDDYECEFDILKHNKKIDLILISTMINNFLKLFNKSPFLIKESEKDIIRKKCLELFKSDKLEVSQLFSLDLNTINNILPNNYAVSQKIDGERHLLYVFKDECYLISCNLEVIKTDLKMKGNNTLYDGEKLYISKERKFVYFIFDILFDNGKDVRSIDKYKKRYELFSDYKQYNKDFDMKNIEKYYETEIIKYNDNLQKLIKDSKTTFINIPIFTIFPLGGSANEVFLYSKILWEHQLLVLDGLTYFPIDSKYRDKKLYKWKPPEMNSIDFYIEFQNNDNSVFDKTTNMGLYKVCNLFSYIYCDSPDKKCKKVRFNYHNQDMSLCNLILKDGVIRDNYGNIITNKTVVEFVYENKTWKPIKVRFDKTDTVRKFNTKIGNSLPIAQHIFSTILENFTFNDIVKLSNNNSITKKENVLDASPIVDYMNAFHDYVKMNLIEFYTSNINAKHILIEYNILLLNSTLNINKSYDTKILKQYDLVILDNNKLDNINEIIKTMKQFSYLIIFTMDKIKEDKKITYNTTDGKYNVLYDFKKNDIKGFDSKSIDLQLIESQSFIDFYKNNKIYIDKGIIKDQNIINYYNNDYVHNLLDYTEMLKYYIFLKK